MAAHYDRFVVIAVGIALVACLGWLFFRPPKAEKVTEYLPAEVDMVVAFTLANESTLIEPVAAYVQQLRSEKTKLAATLPQPIATVVWSYDTESKQEYILLQTEQNLPLAFASKIKKITWPALPWSNQLPEATIINSHWLALSTTNYSKPAESLAAAELLNEPGIRLWFRSKSQVEAFSTRLNDTTLPAVTADGIFPWQLAWQKQEGLERWQLQDTSLVSALPLSQLHLPAETDFYFHSNAGSRDLLQAFPQAAAELEKILPLQLALPWSEISQWQEPLQVAWNQGRWWLAAEALTLEKLIPYFSSVFNWKQQVGRLPDGTTYREIVRSSAPATTTEWQGRLLQTWQSDEEHLFYAPATHSASYVMNSLDFNPLETTEAQEQWFIDECIGLSAEVESMLWVKPENIALQTASSSVSIKEIMVARVKNGEQSLQTICFR